MKATFIMMPVQNGAKRIPMGLLLAVAVTFLQQDATAQGTINLRSASTYGVLAGSTVTGTATPSTVNGDLGVSPGTAVTGSPIVTGTQHLGDAAAAQAQNDLTTAYNDAAGRPVAGANIFSGGDNQLGGQTLFPGVYRFGTASTANLIGTLTLDANGSLTPVWIFQATSTLITAAGARVNLINGATPADVFWQVGSSATLGLNTVFMGTIMADQSITMNTGATLGGNALARIAAVNLDGNTIVGVPEPGTAALVGTGLAILFAFRRRHSSPT